MTILMKCAIVMSVNIVSFYALKLMYDTQEVRLVSELMPSTVVVGKVGVVIRKTVTPHINKDKSYDIKTTYKKLGFEKVSYGTGVIVSKEGLIFTCAHVVRGTSLMEVSMTEFIQPKLPLPRYKTTGKMLAYVVARNDDADIALIKVINPKQTFQYVKLAKSLSKGQPVLAIGYPNVFVKHVTTGVVSSFKHGFTFSDLVIEHGSSGGGVYDRDGHLVGLVSFISMPGFSGITNLEAMRKMLEAYK